MWLSVVQRLWDLLHLNFLHLLVFLEMKRKKGISSWGTKQTDMEVDNGKGNSENPLALLLALPAFGQLLVTRMAFLLGSPPDGGGSLWRWRTLEHAVRCGSLARARFGFNEINRPMEGILVVDCCFAGLYRFAVVVGCLGTFSLRVYTLSLGSL